MMCSKKLSARSVGCGGVMIWTAVQRYLGVDATLARGRGIPRYIGGRERDADDFTVSQPGPISHRLYFGT